MINRIFITGSVIRNITITFQDIKEAAVSAYGDLSEYTTFTSETALYIKTIDEDITFRSNKGPRIDALDIVLPNSFKGTLVCQSLNARINIKSIGKHLDMLEIEGLRNVLDISNGSTTIKMDGLQSKIFTDNVAGVIDIDGLSWQVNVIDNLNISIKLDGLSSKIIHNGSLRKSTFGSITYKTPLIKDNGTLIIDGDGLKSTVNIVSSL